MLAEAGVGDVTNGLRGAVEGEREGRGGLVLRVGTRQDRQVDDVVLPGLAGVGNPQGALPGRGPSAEALGVEAADDAGVVDRQDVRVAAVVGEEVHRAAVDRGPTLRAEIAGIGITRDQPGVADGGGRGIVATRELAGARHHPVAPHESNLVHVGRIHRAVPDDVSAVVEVDRHGAVGAGEGAKVGDNVNLGGERGGPKGERGNGDNGKIHEQDGKRFW